MKRTKWSVLFLLLCVLVVTLVVTAGTAFAQTNAPDPAAPADVPAVANTAAQAATPFIVSFAAKFPWIAMALTVIGVLRFFLKPVISLLEAYVKSTPTHADDDFLAKCEASTIYRWLVWVLDWLGSIKPPGSPTTNPALTALAKK